MLGFKSELLRISKLFYRILEEKRNGRVVGKRSDEYNNTTVGSTHHKVH